MADEQTRLAALIAGRQEMVAMKVAETCRLKAPGAPALNASYKAILRTINNQLEKLDRQIEDLIDACQTLKRRVAACMSLEGVGSRTAITLAAIMLELGSLTRRQAAALAGLAPHPRDSGTLRGYRRMHGGRPQVRTALFMAALAASRTKGPLRAFYQRLIENGKKPIVAISAIMRKIIVILNARIKDQRPNHQTELMTPFVAMARLKNLRAAAGLWGSESMIPGFSRLHPQLGKSVSAAL